MSFIHLHDRARPRKGSISFVGMDSSLSVVFMYNPAEVVRRHGWNHGSASVPGRSHPAYGGGSGDEETVSFTLQLDADRGNFERRMRRNPNANDFEFFDSLTQQDALNGGPQLSQLENLRPVMDEFHQLVLPEGVLSQPEGGYGVPARVFLDLGSVIQAEVEFDSIEEGIFHYGLQHNVLKANLSVTAHVIEQSNLTNVALIERSAHLAFEPDRVRDAQLSRVASFSR